MTNYNEKYNTDKKKIDYIKKLEKKNAKLSGGVDSGQLIRNSTEYKMLQKERDSLNNTVNELHKNQDDFDGDIKRLKDKIAELESKLKMHESSIEGFKGVVDGKDAKIKNMTAIIKTQEEFTKTSNDVNTALLESIGIMAVKISTGKNIRFDG